MPALARLILITTLLFRAFPAGAGEPPTAWTIPIELTSNAPYGQIQVDDSDPLWFVVDTGVSGATIDRATAEKLGLDVFQEQSLDQVVGTGHRITVGVTSPITLRVGGLRRGPAVIWAVPLEYPGSYDGRALHGLLGGGFLSSYVVEFDYAGRVVVLHDPEGFQYQGEGTRVPFVLHKDVMLVKVKLRAAEKPEVEATLCVDTGARFGIGLLRPFATDQDLADSVPVIRDVTVGGGITGEVRGDVGRIDSVAVGDLVIEEPIVTILGAAERAPEPTLYDGYVGGAILRRYRFIVDYPKREVVLEPGPAAGMPYDADMSGLFLITPNGDFRRFTIQSVVEGSPADEVHLRKGDVLTEIDGRPAAEFTLTEVREVLIGVGRRVEIQIQRQEESFTVELVLRRLV